jgi:hypothetical protein
VEAIQESSMPKTLMSLWRILAMFGFYARFVGNFSRLAKLLHALKQKKAMLLWGECQQNVFYQIKTVLHTPPIL